MQKEIFFPLIMTLKLSSLSHLTIKEDLEHGYENGLFQLALSQTSNAWLFTL